MNAKKTIPVIGVAVLTFAIIGAYIWWPKVPTTPIVQNDKDKDKDKDKGADKKPNDKQTPKVMSVVYNPAPVSLAAAT